MTRYIFSIILAFSIAGMFALAEPVDDYTRIARISYMEGNVSFQGTTDVDWTAAAINFPLQPGDRIYTGPGGRAEIEFDEGSVLRLAESTDIQFLSLRENLIQIRILTGLSSLTVSSDLEFEVDTPAAAFIALRDGSYRFDADDSGDTTAIVRKGELETVSHRFVRRVQSGESIFVTARENSSYKLSNYYGRDAWDEWNDRRNADRIARRSGEYVPGDVYVGVSELDRHGRWVTVDSYGAAWVPLSVGVSWSPYSVGRWCYRPTWGWTWVSYEPWGWLPFHYGRWYRSVQYGWCWLPGPSFSFHFWSPGLVTFYSGPNWVSWCPLGPGDYYSINNYYYNKRVYNHYVVNLKKLHYRRPGDGYNRHDRGAFKTMDIAHFRNGRSNGVATPRGYKNLDRPWEQGKVVRERLAVRPSADSFSPDPGRQAVRSKIEKPRPAIVLSKPSAKLKKPDAFERIKNKDITSQVARRSHESATSDFRDSEHALSPAGSRSGVQTPRSGPGSAVRRRTESPSAIDRNNQRSGSSDLLRRRTENVTKSGNTASRRPETGRNSGSSTNNRGNGTVRSQPQVQSRQFIDRPTPERTTGSNSSSRFDPGRTGSSGSSSSRQSGVTSNRTRSIPSVSRTRSTHQNSGSANRESIGVPRSSSSPSAARSTQSSSSRSRTYSAPSSSNRSRSSSVSSSRSSSRIPSVSSSRSSSRSSSASSSRSSSSRSRSSVSSRSSSKSSSSSASSQKSSSGTKSSSSSRSARSRD